MDNVTVTVIGAGVIGLAIAAEVSKRFDGVVVLERHERYGQETSSRNSEVIHSGIYYPEGSLKTRLCIEGAERLYELCSAHAIPHKRLGKLIIATEESELPAIEKLYAQGLRNGVKDLFLLDRSETRGIEPHTNAISALYSPNTGIIDSHALMKHFHAEAAARGALFAFQSNVDLLQKEKADFVIGITRDSYRFRSKIVINCAGLRADAVAGLAGMDVRARGYGIRLCKGSYYSYAKPSPVRALVYPVPHEHLTGLGVHATLDLGGRLRFGPDAEYLDAIDYSVDVGKKEAFYQGASKIIPGLERDAFLPDMAGIRPKLSGPGEQVRDFVITEETKNGLPGLINLIGIESPGLTASPAIAGMVSDMVFNLLA